MMRAADVHDLIAKKIWVQIRSVKSQKTKAVIASAVNRGRQHPWSVAVMFGTAVRLRLEDIAAADGKAVIIEDGYVFATTEADRAIRRMIKRITFGISHNTNLDSPGNGYALLKASGDPTHQEAAALAANLAVGARMARDIELASVRASLKAKDDAVRAETRRKAAESRAGTRSRRRRT